MKTARILIALMATAISLNVAAHEVQGAAGKDHETVTPLQQLALPDMPGKKATMATVRYAPGQASIPHEHPGSVFAYVLEGTVESQLEGGPVKTYKAGDSWYEPPHAGHLVSRNASHTKPATLVVFLLASEGEAILKPR
jgi:quercetin dioxygenase-like cupin family protein